MKKQALVLAVIATLTIGLGAWLSQRPSNDKFEAVLMFDDLKKFANQVNSVEIKNAQGVLYSIKKLCMLYCNLPALTKHDHLKEGHCSSCVQ